MVGSYGCRLWFGGTSNSNSSRRANQIKQGPIQRNRPVPATLHQGLIDEEQHLRPQQEAVNTKAAKRKKEEALKKENWGGREPSATAQKKKRESSITIGDYHRAVKE